MIVGHEMYDISQGLANIIITEPIRHRQRGLTLVGLVIWDYFRQGNTLESHQAETLRKFKGMDESFS